jgi:hypothetical protein
MEHPAQDIIDRTPVWDSMQDLFMDTDVSLSYDFIVRRCAESKYTIDELERILFNEVLPALRFNMFALPAPEWAGFNTEWLVKQIIAKHRFGKFRPWILRSYTQQHWDLIKPAIAAARSRN